MVVFRAVAYTSLLFGLFGWMKGFRAGFFPTVAVFLAGVLLIRFPNERPQIFSFLLFPIVLYHLEKLREGARAGDIRRFSFSLPLVMMLWANIHGAFILGQVMILFYFIPAFVRSHRHCSAVQGKFAIICAGAIFAGFLNPNFHQAWVSFGATLGSPAKVYELLPPALVFIRHNHYYPTFWLFLLGVVSVLIWRRREVEPEHFLALAGLTVLSLSAIRHLPYLLLAAPLVVRYLPAWRVENKKGLLIACVVVVWGVTADYGERFLFSAGKFFPVEAANFLLKAQPAGRLFNYYDWGGYLMATAPGYQVFVDGRGMVEEILDLHDRVMFGDGVKEVFETYNINTVVIPGVNTVTGKTYPLTRQLVSDPNWGLIHLDHVALVFIRKIPANRALLEATEINKEVISSYLSSFRDEFLNVR